MRERFEKKMKVCTESSHDKKRDNNKVCVCVAAAEPAVCLFVKQASKKSSYRTKKRRKNQLRWN